MGVFKTPVTRKDWKSFFKSTPFWVIILIVVMLSARFIILLLFNWFRPDRENQRVDTLSSSFAAFSTRGIFFERRFWLIPRTVICWMTAFLSIAKDPFLTYFQTDEQVFHDNAIHSELLFTLCPCSLYLPQMKARCYISLYCLSTTGLFAAPWQFVPLLAFGRTDYNT